MMKKIFSLALSSILCLTFCTGSIDPKTEETPGDNPVVTPDPPAPEPPKAGTAKLYPAPEGLPSNVTGTKHRVKINGESCAVYQTEATGAGKEYGNVYPEYVYFDFDEDGYQVIEVVTNYDFTSVEIQPSRHNITPVFGGHTIRFEITEPGQYFVKTNGDNTNGNTSDNNLYIFANPKETDIPDKNDPNVVWFEPKVYDHKEYQLESNKTYYFEGGSFVYGRLYGYGLKNVKICGRGTLCAEFLTDMGDPGRGICLKNGCDNITIDGINVMHSKVWQVAVYQSTNIHINNVHTISHGQSSDGCDITGCKDVVVENSFFRGHDDILAVKSIVWGEGTPMDCERVKFYNCVVWSDSSNPMTIGYETAQNVRDITYEKIDVLSMSMPPVWQLEAVMAIEPHGYDTVGDVDGVLYKDIRVDLAVPQRALFRLSVDNGGNIRNITFDDIYVNYGGSMGGLLYGQGNYTVDNITFRNVRNSNGDKLARNNITSNSKVGTVTLDPEVAECTVNGTEWNFSTEFGGYGYQQGANNWYYRARKVRTNEVYDMQYDNNNRWFYDGSCSILFDRTDSPGYGDSYSYFPKWSAGMISSTEFQSCLVWKAPAGGTVAINVKARKHQNGGDGIILNICKNGSDPFSAKAIGADKNTFVEFSEVTKDVAKGDEIWFILDVKKNNNNDFTQVVPSIKYIAVD